MNREKRGRWCLASPPRIELVVQQSPTRGDTDGTVPCLDVRAATCREGAAWTLALIRVGERSGLSTLTSDRRQSDKYPTGDSCPLMAGISSGRAGAATDPGLRLRGPGQAFGGSRARAPSAAGRPDDSERGCRRGAGRAPVGARWATRRSRSRAAPARARGLPHAARA